MMKDIRAKLLPTLQKESRAAIEKRAEVELNPGVIRVAMMNAAKLGQTTLRVRIPSNLDVNGTDAKATFEKWCIDEGLTLTWEGRSVELEDGRRVTILEPEISWLVKS
jgi:hypothetical protein